MDNLILFLLVAGIVYFVAWLIGLFLPHLHPPRTTPSWLMPVLALITAACLVYLSPNTLPSLPFPSAWSNVWRVLILAVAGLALARRV